MGRVNGTLNLSRAIDILFFTRFFLFIVLTLPDVLHMQNTFLGDMEFKQNKFLSPDKQILTANPDINIVSKFCSCLSCYVDY